MILSLCNDFDGKRCVTVAWDHQNIATRNIPIAWLHKVATTPPVDNNAQDRSRRLRHAAVGVSNELPRALRPPTPTLMSITNADNTEPTCPGCGDKMLWSNFLGGPYAKLNSWKCEHYEECKSDLENCGEERWFCSACNKDLCRFCYAHWNELPNAFVAVVYGCKISYCIEAAVLGQCLRDVGTKHTRVLMHTDDVPQTWLKVFQDVGWTLEQVGYIDGEVMTSDQRFRGVFTKLHALKLIQFEKIVLLDVDLLVRKNVDNLFKKKAPCAMRRHANGSLPDGARITKGSINAGVMVLQTSLEQYKKMMEHLRITRRKAMRGEKQTKSNQPEQDYLSKFYGRDWVNLGVEYNFQPHQLAFTDRRGLENCRRLTMNVDHVIITHFSALPKPCSWLLDPEYRCKTREEFIEGPLLQQYTKGLGTGRGARSSTLPRNEIEEILRKRTRTLSLEWFQAWDRLVRNHPNVNRLISRQETLPHTQNPAFSALPLQLALPSPESDNTGNPAPRPTPIKERRRHVFKQRKLSHAPRMTSSTTSPLRKEQKKITAHMGATNPSTYRSSADRAKQLQIQASTASCAREASIRDEANVLRSFATIDSTS